jgi:hypothetical protein
MRDIRKFSKLDSKAIAKAFVAKELVSDKMRGCKKLDQKNQNEERNVMEQPTTTKQAIISKKINEAIRVLKVEFPEFKNWDYIYRLLEPLAERWYKQKRKVESDPDDFEQHNKRLREIERGQ